MEVATIDANDTVHLTPVTLGRNLGTDVEILQGLSAADRVINSPPDSLSTGDKVRVAVPEASSGKTEEASAGGEGRPNSNPLLLWTQWNRRGGQTNGYLEARTPR